MGYFCLLILRSMSTVLSDSFRHQGLRQQLVEEVKKKGIGDPRVLAALGRVPRHFFLDNVFTELAYTDQAMPIGAGQTISQPYTVAFQTELLGVEERMKVLEIGTGSGYQACVLEEMGHGFLVLSVNAYCIRQRANDFCTWDEKSRSFLGTEPSVYRHLLLLTELL